MEGSTPEQSDKSPQPVLDVISTIGEAIAVLIQGAKIAVGFRKPDGKSLFNFNEIRILGEAIDFITQVERPTPNISNITEAVTALIQGNSIGQEYVAFDFADARLIAEAIDFLTIPQESPKNQS